MKGPGAPWSLLGGMLWSWPWGQRFSAWFFHCVAERPFLRDHGLDQGLAWVKP